MADRGKLEDSENQSKNKRTSGLVPFKPGQSGNPAGRPRRRTISERIDDILKKDKLAGIKVPDGQCVADVLAEQIVKHACKGRFPYAKEVIDRIEGKVPDRIAGHDGGPLNLGIDVDLSRLSNDELDSFGSILEKLTRPDVPVDIGDDARLDSFQALEAVRSERCRRSLSAFVRAAWPVLEPGTTYLPNWHIDLIAEHLEAVTRGEITRLVINMPPRYMKPVYTGSMILLSSGKRVRLEDIAVGNEVVTHMGRPGLVLAVHEQGLLPTVRITTDTGRSVVTAYDHPFLTPNGWVKAGDLVLGDVLALVRSLDDRESSHPSEEFRMAGYFVGDGTCKEYKSKFPTPFLNATITCFDPEQARDVEHCANFMGFGFNRSKVAGRLNLTDGVRPWLRETGLAGTGSHTKRVPPFVFEGSPDQVAHFIGAYFACDGTLQKKSVERRALTINFSSVNRPLLADVQHLLLRLGIRARLRTKVTKYSAFVKGPHTSYLLELSTQDDTAKFVSRIPVYGAKSARLKAWGVQRTAFDPQFVPDKVVAIEPAGELPCRCLTVEGDHSFLIEDIAVHNSLMCSVFWPAWEWITRPETRWMFVSYSKDLSTKHSIDRRQVIESDWYRERWGKTVQLSDGANLKTEFMNTKRGVMVATSVGGTATGKGGDRIICDDIHNPEQAESDLERTAGIRFFDRSLSNRLDDKHRGAIVCVMQRLHEEDLSGRLLDLGYVHLKLPVEAYDRTVVPFPSGREVVRERGDLLWPAREGPAEITAARKALGSYAFAGQYDQEPAPPGGGLFRREWFRVVEAAPAHALQRVRYWDFASSLQGDYTVGVRMARTHDGLYYVEDVTRGRWSPMDRDRIVLQCAQGDGKAVHVVVEQEPGSSGVSVVDATVRMLAGYVIHGERATGDKVTRAQPFAAQCEAGNVRLVNGPWVGAFLDELTSFPMGKHDDQVDSASAAFNRLASTPAPGGYASGPRITPAVGFAQAPRFGGRR